jgi:hypothetical protein
MSEDLNKILNIIDNAPQAFNDKLPAIEKKIYREIIVLLKDLKTTPDGKIEAIVENLQLLNSIKGKIGKIVISKEYAKLVEDFVRNIPTVMNLQTAIYSAPAETKKMISQTAKMNIDNTLESLIGSGIKQNVVNKLYQTLITNVTAGGSYADMIETLRNSLTTNEQGEGMLVNNARLFVENALSQFAGQSNKMVADMLNSEWFRYVGNNRTTTREFCEHLTKKEWVHKSEIPTLLKGEIDGHQCEIYERTGLPKGMIDGTNEENFIVYKGGWNCNHHLMAVVNENDVPKAVRQKFVNIEHRKDLFNKFNKDRWQKEYFDKESGGFVVIDRQRIEQSKKSKNERAKYEKELSMSMTLAKNGYQVEYLQDKPNSYDIYINGIKADLKKVSSATNIVRYAKKAIREQGASAVIFEFDKMNNEIHNELYKLKKKSIKVFYFSSNDKEKEVIEL